MELQPMSFRRSADWAVSEQHHSAWPSCNIKWKPGNEPDYGV